MSAAPLDLSTPEARSTYRRELRGVARALLLGGFVFMSAGVLQRTRYHLRRLAGGERTVDDAR
jgi:hypothetical protein